MGSDSRSDAPRGYGDYGDHPGRTLLIWVLVSVLAPPILWWLIENDILAIF